MNTEQPLALKLADELEIIYGSLNTPHECAAELRRQHAEIAKLRETLRIADKFCGSLTSDVCPDSVHIPIRDALAQGENT